MTTVLIPSTLPPICVSVLIKGPLLVTSSGRIVHSSSPKCKYKHITVCVNVEGIIHYYCNVLTSNFASICHFCSATHFHWHVFSCSARPLHRGKVQSALCTVLYVQVSGFMGRGLWAPLCKHCTQKGEWGKHVYSSSLVLNKYNWQGKVITHPASKTKACPSQKHSMLH